MKEIKIFNNISGGELNTIYQKIRLQIIKLSSRETLFEENDVLDSFFFVYFGNLQSGHFSSNGKYEINNIFSEKDFIALDIVNTFTRKAPFTVSAIKECKLLKIPREIFTSDAIEKITRDIITENMLNILADISIKRDYYTWILHEKNTNTKIYMYLNLMMEINDSSVFDIDIPRLEMAQFLGMNRTVLSNRLSEMQKKGIIKFNRSHFEILDTAEMSKHKF